MTSSTSAGSSDGTRRSRSLSTAAPSVTGWTLRSAPFRLPTAVRVAATMYAAILESVLEWILRSVTASPRDAQTFLSQEEVITFLFHEKLPTAIEFGYSASCDLETNSFHQNVRLI